ncbi:MAG: LPS translocon maturation chaperone LptM [Gallionellaceae bacterium]
MRLGITLGIIVVLAALLQGCGHKGPLAFPAPAASPSQQSK